MELRPEQDGLDYCEKIERPLFSQARSGAV
jgi:hypothetical protein